MGLRTSPSGWLYRASKAALNMLMHNLAVDLKPRGIKVLLVNPGLVDTRGIMSRKPGDPVPEEFAAVMPAIESGQLKLMTTTESVTGMLALLDRALQGARLRQVVNTHCHSDHIGGNAAISYDVPPYAIAADRNQIHGLNLVGLRRSKMSSACVADLKRCYHAVYSGPGDLRARVNSLLGSQTCGVGNPGQQFLQFFAGGKRGFARPRLRRGEAGERDAGVD
jgi:glyoxylase-like metal-dependent hydrolase (beta-lactamase superfamily II)